MRRPLDALTTLAGTTMVLGGLALSAASLSPAPPPATPRSRPLSLAHPAPPPAGPALASPSATTGEVGDFDATSSRDPESPGYAGLGL